MTSNETIIDKIRKLLRLSQSSNPHEAELALNHAMRLANQHNIDVAALDLDPEIEKIIHERFPAGERLSYITKLALGIAVNFFHVEIVLARPEVIFVGSSTNVAIARYAQGYLTGASQVLRWLITNDGGGKLSPQIIERACVTVGKEHGFTVG